MDGTNPQCPFERYADDIVIHCASKEEAEKVLARLAQRMGAFALALHPEKTKIVYCRNYKRTERHGHESFVFLSYSFQPRPKMDRFKSGYRTYMIFAPDMCNKARASIREGLRRTLIPRRTDCTMEGFAKLLNPKVRGWVNYYTRFYDTATRKIFYYLNGLIREWVRNKYGMTTKTAVYTKYNAMQEEQPGLFYHWELGITT